MKIWEWLTAEHATSYMGFYNMNLQLKGVLMLIIIFFLFYFIIKSIILNLKIKKINTKEINELEELLKEK